MGHSHSWNYNTQLTRADITNYKDKVDRLIKHGILYSILQDDSTLDCVMFNGIDDNAYEDFYITFSESGYQWCKTNLKPYDKYVVAALLVFKYTFGDKVEIRTDGTFLECLAGIELFHKLYTEEEYTKHKEYFNDYNLFIN